MPQKVQALNTRQAFAGLRSKWSQALTDCKKFLLPGGQRQLPESFPKGDGETSVACLKNPRLDWPDASRKIKPVQLRFFLHVEKARMRTGLKHNSCPNHPSHHGFMLWRISISTWS
jgi:hypothetical protein